MEELYQQRAIDYLSRLTSLGPEGFLELHPQPVLLASHRGLSDRNNLFLLKTIANEPRGTTGENHLEARFDDEVLQARVIPVDKREANSPEHMIFLGRSPTNDVVITDTRVSKLHAYFCRLPGEDEYRLVDMNSTNGTFVNGERLVPSVKKTLRDADEVAFGRETRLIFFTASGFCELLRELNGATELRCGSGEGQGGWHRKGCPRVHGEGNRKNC